MLLVAAVYHGWRYWYFGELLPMPVFAKLQFRFVPAFALLTKLPAQSYFSRWVQSLGLPFAVLIALLVAIGVRLDARARPLALALGVLLIYISVIGDWMFGFR